jgi:hypothetical protein
MRLITAAAYPKPAPISEYLVPGLDLGRLDHQRDDVRL